MTPPRIAVIGGGITGLAAAYELRDDAQVVIFEATDRLGGKVSTTEVDGIQIEEGPDSLLARDSSPIDLLHELGLGEDIVEPNDFGAWIAVNGKLKKLPARSVLGIPTSPIALATSRILSPLGLTRAARDLVAPRTHVGDDISVGELVRSRFGNEVAERIVAPLMSGIRAGDIDEMSLDMAAPQIADVARNHRSLTLGLRASLRASAGTRFIGLRRGMSTLVDELSRRSNAEIRLSSSVGSIENTSIDGEQFDGIVIAVPPHDITVSGLAALPQVEFTSTVVMNLVYPQGTIRPPSSGTGILVPPSAGQKLIACTWFTRKWPHLAPNDGRDVVRCVAEFGTAEDEIVHELADLLGVRSNPVSSHVRSWQPAQPIFTVGHRARVRGMQQQLAGRPLRIAGAGVLATGLNDCLVHGREAAQSVMDIVHRRLAS